MVNFLRKMTNLGPPTRSVEPQCVILIVMTSTSVFGVFFFSQKNIYGYKSFHFTGLSRFICLVLLKSLLFLVNSLVCLDIQYVCLTFVVFIFYFPNLCVTSSLGRNHHPIAFTSLPWTSMCLVDFNCFLVVPL